MIQKSCLFYQLSIIYSIPQTELFNRRSIFVQQSYSSHYQTNEIQRNPIEADSQTFTRFHTTNSTIPSRILNCISIENNTTMPKIISTNHDQSNDKSNPGGSRSEFSSNSLPKNYRPSPCSQISTLEQMQSR